MASDNQVSSILLLILIGLAIYFLLNPYDGFTNTTNNMEFFDDLSMNNSDLANSENFYESIDNSVDNYSADNNSVDNYSADNYSAESSLNNSADNYSAESSLNYSAESSLNNSAESSLNYSADNSLNNSAQSSLNYSAQNSLNNSAQSSLNYSAQNSLNNSAQSSLNYSAQNSLDNYSEPVVSQNLLSEIINESSAPSGSQPTLFEPKNIVPINYSNNMLGSNQVLSDLQMSSSNTINNIANFDPNSDEYGTDLNNAFNNSLPANANPNTIDFKKNNVDKYNAKDFLPKEVNDEWFETDFSLAKYQLNDDKLINTEKYIIGINTVGESLKNATYDIRGTIPNPKFVVSPWNNSTYEPDFNLKPLC